MLLKHFEKKDNSLAKKLEAKHLEKSESISKASRARNADSYSRRALGIGSIEPKGQNTSEFMVYDWV